MPLYEFRCECGEVVEELTNVGAESLQQECPVCQEERTFKRIISSPVAHFKGSGFYETDYKRR